MSRAALIEERDWSDWRSVIHARFANRAEPVLVVPGGIRSAASLWSGARLWVHAFRAEPHRRCVIVQPWTSEELAVQLLMAVLWLGLDLHVVAAPSDRRGVALLDPGSCWYVDEPSHPWHGVPVGAGQLAVEPGGWPMSSVPAGVSGESHPQPESAAAVVVLHGASAPRAATHAALLQQLEDGWSAHAQRDAAVRVVPHVVQVGHTLQALLIAREVWGCSVSVEQANVADFIASWP